MVRTVVLHGRYSPFGFVYYQKVNNLITALLPANYKNTPIFREIESKVTTRAENRQNKGCFLSVFQTNTNIIA